VTGSASATATATRTGAAGSAIVGAILAIDTATSRCIVAMGGLDGRLVGELAWPADHRHTASLLPAIARVLGENGQSPERLAGIVIGTGPGAFTGLRVGLATAKTLAHELGRPIVGISTAEALLAAASAALPGEGDLALLLPAGPSDRVLIRPGQPPQLLPGGTDPELESREVLVAVDLSGRAPEDAIDRGRLALAGIAPALLRMGAVRIAGGTPDDLDTLVPEYVTLPRGVRSTAGEIEWSRDPR
jgi:tRNA N6-adenosine threonylcarbamoyltransferase